MKKFLTKRKLIIIGVIALIILGIRYISARNGRLEVEVEEAKKEDLVESISASGEIKATESASLTFQSSGQVSWVGVKEGDIVKKYQALAKLDTVVLNAAYQQARADYRSAEATVQKVHDDLKDHDSDETYTQKETRTTAEVARDKAYDALLAAEKSLKNATLTSPFEGIVTNISETTVAGANILATTPALSVVNPETIYFQAEVNETEVIKLKLGQQAQISLDAFPEATLKGTITHIDYLSTTTSTGGTAYQVNIELSGHKDLLLRLGMGGDAEFTLSSKQNVLTVPISAVVDQDGKDYVWVSVQGQAKQIEVTTAISSVSRIEIVSGLSEGQQVIKRPPADITEGARLKVS